MINRIIAFIIALIVLALAGEGGYVLGINAGKRVGVQETLNKQTEQQKIEKPSAIIPVTNQLVSQWVEQVNNLPLSAIWNSTWQVSIGGKFVSMNDKSIVLEIEGERKTIILPIEISKIENVQFSQYNIETKVFLPNSIKQEEIAPGSLISINLTINTLTGKASFLDISKQIGQKLFN